METSIEKIPTWALCALINDDFSDINDEEFKLISEWLHDSRLCVIAPQDYNEYFTSVPAFGKPCMVMDCVCETY